VGAAAVIDSTPLFLVYCRRTARTTSPHPREALGLNQSNHIIPVLSGKPLAACVAAFRRFALKTCEGVPLRPCPGIPLHSYTHSRPSIIFGIEVSVLVAPVP